MTIVDALARRAAAGDTEAATALVAPDVELALPKPPRRGPKARKPIPRRSRPRPMSTRRKAVMAEDREWSYLVKNAANGYCELRRCDSRTRGPIGVATDAHHVRSKKAHPELRHEQANGVALCRRCHTWAHLNGREFRAWFKASRPISHARIYGEEAA